MWEDVLSSIYIQQYCFNILIYPSNSFFCIMGFLLIARIRNFVCLSTLHDLLLCLIKVLLAISEEDADDSVGESHRPSSPSLVQVPVQFIVGSIKERLPVMEYGCLVENLGGCKEEGSSSCAVCLKCVGGRDEVRELGNCSHTFHRECLDGWVDQGQITCPLCRSQLLPADRNEKLIKSGGGGGDPWRRERMIYLFGEDGVFSNTSS